MSGIGSRMISAAGVISHADPLPGLTDVRPDSRFSSLQEIVLRTLSPM